MQNQFPNNQSQRTFGFKKTGIPAPENARERKPVTLTAKTAQNNLGQPLSVNHPSIPSQLQSPKDAIPAHL